MVFSLELQIMTPALIGDPGSHYVCFVVNLKSKKFEFLNSLNGENLYTKNGAPTVYKDMFDIWLNEVEVFVAEMYRRRKIQMPFKFTTFQWDSPKMPNQIDKYNCGVFCMKFLVEWAGDNTQMDSFKCWKRMIKKLKVARMMDLRIGICSTILSDTSNSRRNLVENEAKKYHATKLEKLTS
jgi:Ulp1 family protease